MDIQYIGWCNQPTRNHDKVWGIAKHADGHVTFWGRRGKKLSHKVKLRMSNHEVNKLIQSKMKKGYDTIDPDRADEVYERFGVDMFMVAMTAKI